VGSRAETRPQTHFDASSGLKTHLVAAAFISPTFHMTQNASFPLDLDAPAPLRWIASQSIKSELGETNMAFNYVAYRYKKAYLTQR